MKKLLLLALAVVTLSCSKKDDYEKFSKVYTQILIAREMYSDSASGHSAVQKILEQNGYSMKTFGDEFAKLSQDPEKLKDMFGRIRSDAKRQADSLKKLNPPTPKDTSSNQPVKE